MVEDRDLDCFRSVTDETPNVHRGFCGKCGSSLFWHPGGEEIVALAAGSMDEPTGMKMMGHVWVSQKKITTKSAMICQSMTSVGVCQSGQGNIFLHCRKFP